MQLNDSIPAPRKTFARRRRRINWPYQLACGGILLGLTLAIGLPGYLAYRSDSSNTEIARRLTGVLVARDRAMDCIAAGFLLALGGCIGSFLNVVVYRVPRGQTILGHSMCPYCRTRIAALDNIPIFAWLQLRGRCRTCRLPIAARYVWVEFVVAMLFFVLGIVEMGTWGANLPNVTRPHHLGFAWAILLPDIPIGIVYLAHMSLLSTLVAATLIRADGQPLPRGLWWFTTLAIFIAHLASSAMHPVPWQEWQASPRLAIQPHPDLRIPVDGLVGLVIALGFAMIVSHVSHNPSASVVTFPCMMLTGWAMGWQGTLTTWIIASSFHILFVDRFSRSWRERGAAWCCDWTVATLLHLLTWRWTHEAWADLPSIPIGVCSAIIYCSVVEWNADRPCPTRHHPLSQNHPRD